MQTVLLGAVSCLILLCFIPRLQCRGVTTRNKRCRARPQGLLGRCPSHGRFTWVKAIAGRARLERRRTCDCGAARVLRQNRTGGGFFLGCRTFPTCRHRLAL